MPSPGMSPALVSGLCNSWQTREAMPDPLAGVDDDQAVLAGGRAPDLAGATQQLADVRAGRRVRQHLERLAGGIETYQCVRPEVGEPDGAVVVHVDRVRHRVAARELPLPPV